jgi:hypothetical protein
MMKVLDYEKVNGTQDRDDTLLVAQIIPRSSETNQHEAQDGATVVAAAAVSNGHYFDQKDIIVSQVHHNPGHGPLSPAATPGKEQV